MEDGFASARVLDRFGHSREYRAVVAKIALLRANAHFED